MKKALIAVLAAGTIMLSGCGPKEPAPLGARGEWSEVDGVGVLVNKMVPSGDMRVTVRNDKKRGDISSDDVMIKGIEGENIEDEMVDSIKTTFDMEFTKDIAPGKTARAQVPVDSPYYLKGATVTVSVDDQAFPIALPD